MLCLAIAIVLGFILRCVLAIVLAPALACTPVYVLVHVHGIIAHFDNSLGPDEMRARANDDAVPCRRANAVHLLHQAAQIRKTRRAVGVGEEDQLAACVQHTLRMG